jgi:hypothetical protein
METKDGTLPEYFRSIDVIRQACLFPGLDRHERRNAQANKLFVHDQPFHDWYRFVLSFPPHLVREYFDRFQLKKGNILLDPFCGPGTTLIEAKLHQLCGIGIEANKMAHFASHVKCDWSINPGGLLEDSQMILKRANRRIATFKENQTFSDEQFNLVLKDSMDTVVLHRTLILRDAIEEHGSEFRNHQLLALATSTVRFCSKLYFGPEVGVSAQKKVRDDVTQCWLSVIRRMEQDITDLDQLGFRNLHYPATVYFGDSRNVNCLVKNSIDAVFTSPPYPNEKDYTRTTRLESVLLGFINGKAELREMKEGLLRSNTRNVYKNDHDDDYVLHNAEVLKIAEEIEQKRIGMGKTSGFEKLYHRVVRLYFGGMARHLDNLKPFLKKGAMLGYVVGDQASYLQTFIPTGKILGDIAVHLGYHLESIDLFRTRFATVTKRNMNEEVVVLKWKG